MQESWYVHFLFFIPDTAFFSEKKLMILFTTVSLNEEVIVPTMHLSKRRGKIVSFFLGGGLGVGMLLHLYFSDHAGQ